MNKKIRLGSKMKKEIGSNFWQNRDFYKNKDYNIEKILKDIQIEEENYKFFSAARQAITFALRDSKIKNIRALIPEFTCYSVIEPFLLEKGEVFSYPVLKNNLSIKVSKLNNLIDENNINVLLIHPYFGFNTIIYDEELRDDLVVIFDDTQGIYSNFNYDFYDYKLVSLRKWGPLVDGSLLVKKDSFNIVEDFKENKRLTPIMMEAMDKKAKYMDENKGDKDIFLSLYREGLNCIRENKDLNRISEESLISQTYMDIDDLKKKRNNNFKSLLDFNWCYIGRPIFNEIDDDIVPLFFPFYVNDNRKDLQKFLAKNNIYAPIIWGRPDYYKEKDIILDRNTEYIYNHILCIPIDQRYDLDDMNKVKRVLEDFEK